MSEPIVVVPKAAFDRYVMRPWDEVYAAALRSDDGLIAGEGVRSAASDTAVLRSANRSERSLQGMTLLHSRGW